MGFEFRIGQEKTEKTEKRKKVSQEIIRDHNRLFS